MSSSRSPNALSSESKRRRMCTPPIGIFSSRITTARAALESGVPPEIVRKAYGEQVLAAASADH
jgi:hypothetical protein